MMPVYNPSINLQQVQVRPLDSEEDNLKSSELLDAHDYLKDVHAVGERIRDGVFDAAGQWLGVLVFCTASRRLRAREHWIGWSDEQRRRRLPLVVNNSRFLLLPDKTAPQKTKIHHPSHLSHRRHRPRRKLRNEQRTPRSQNSRQKLQ